MDIDPLDAYMAEVEASCGSPIQSTLAASADWEASGARRRLTEEDRRSQLIRNRRYKKLQELIATGEYFSDHNMMQRQPTLYHEYVGRFRDQQAPRPFDESAPLYERLLHDYDVSEAERRRLEEAGEPVPEEPVPAVPRGKLQAFEEDTFEEEFDSDEDHPPGGSSAPMHEEDMMDASHVDAVSHHASRNIAGAMPPEVVSSGAMEGGTFGRMQDVPSSKVGAASEDDDVNMPLDEEASYQEFVSIMHEKFLRGEDDDYDYKECDLNDSICALEEDQDGEAAYFDSHFTALEPTCHADGDLL